MVPVVGVVFFSQSLPEVFGGQTQKKVDFPSMHCALFRHLFGLQLFASCCGFLLGAPVKGWIKYELEHKLEVVSRMIAEAGTNAKFCSCSDHETWTEVKALWKIKTFPLRYFPIFWGVWFIYISNCNPNPEPFNTTLTKPRNYDISFCQNADHRFVWIVWL